MTDDVTAPAGADLDPEIRRFVELLSASWAQHPALDGLAPAEARRIAEVVRAPWVLGGPEMLRTSEHQVTCGDSRVRIRVLDPIGAGVNPALVYLHGGGWSIFSIDTHDRLMREYAHRARVVVIAVDYSLAPEARFPRALEECAAVVRWLRSQGSAIGVDADRIAIGGDSAGANLSVATALMLRDAEEGDALKAMLLNYGAFDSACNFPSYRRFGGAGYMLGDQEMVSFWRNYLGGSGRSASPLACPLRANLAGLPDAFVAVAQCDVLYDENMAMIERLRQHHVAVQAEVYAGTAHSFLEAVSMSRIADLAIGDAARWLQGVLHRSVDRNGYR